MIFPLRVFEVGRCVVPRSPRPPSPHGGGGLRCKPLTLHSLRMPRMNRTALAQHATLTLVCYVSKADLSAVVSTHCIGSRMHSLGYCLRVASPISSFHFPPA